MSSNKRSVYLTDDTLTTLGQVDAEDRAGWSLSGRLNAIVERYNQIISESMPEFSKWEWSALLDANSGSLILLWANVADSPELPEKWGINLQNLVVKLQGLSRAQAAAVTEAIYRFWHHCDLPTEEAMAKAGIKLQEPEPPRNFVCPKCGGKHFGVMMKKSPRGMVRDRIACHSLANGEAMSRRLINTALCHDHGSKPCGWIVPYSDDAPCWHAEEPSSPIKQVLL